MHISKEELAKLRKRQRSRLTNKNSSRASSRKEKRPRRQLKIRIKDKPQSTPAGRDVPHAHDEQVKKALHETCQILPHQSDLERELRRTHDVAFATNALETIRLLHSVGVDLLFFSLKGLPAYRLLHCANRHAFQDDADFENELKGYCEYDSDLFLKPETIQWIVGESEIVALLDTFDSRDRARFSEIVGWILKNGRCENIEFLGHDRRQKEE